MKCNSNLLVLSFLLLPFILHAQKLSVDENSVLRKFPSASLIHNRITQVSSMDSFFIKLSELKAGQRKNLRIVHIGDSHIQPDHLTGVVRDKLQSYFGNSGRGLIFPYSLARSNSPSDIKSSSNTGWEFNRIAHPEIKIDPGISGFVIRNKQPGASISLSLPESTSHNFTKARLFFDDETTAWLLHSDADSNVYMVKKEAENFYFADQAFGAASRVLKISAMGGQPTNQFFGVSLENDEPGILVHTIGVNGARYDQYNLADKFWKQLPGLEGDLFIVSLGTNESQRSSFNPSEFIKHMDLFLSKLRAAAPGASILLTTTADSYKKGKPNSVLKQFNNALAAYAQEKRIALWDLYKATNGYGSCYTWSRRGLMSRDKIHFTSEGYKLMGEMLYIALAKAYNSLHQN